MENAEGAYLGLWRDYNRRYIDQLQILATDFWSRWMAAFVAVCLTLISPCVFRIAKSFLVSLFSLLDRLAAEWSSPPSETRSALLSTRHPRPSYGTMQSQEHSEGFQRPDHQRPDKNSATHTSQEQSSHQNGDIDSPTRSQTVSSESQTHLEDSARGPVRILARGRDSREIVWDFVKSLLHKGKKESEDPSIAMIVISTILFGLFVAQATAGVFSAKIASDRIGLSSSDHCGIWQFDDDAGEEAADRDDFKNPEKEARASQYAHDCYALPTSHNTPPCQIFYNQSIAFTTETKQRCPFFSQELCLDGLYSAVTFDTGIVDASTIGVNFPVAHKFRRISTCAPVTMSHPFIEGPLNGTSNDTYEYYYGHKDNADYTFRTSGRPFEWLAPDYLVNTYFSSLYPDSDYWQPVEGLRPPTNSTLTIMFISSMHIYHTEQSLDPIFPATTPRYFEDLSQPFYYNSDPRAKVLACVDTTELCSPDGETCWSMTAPVPTEIPSTPAYWLMKWSLESSDIYNSIKWRLGSALLAQERIRQFVSTPLSRHHWQIEASRLFATSLASIQFEALGIATGEGRELPGYIDVTPNEAKGDLCKIYKFRTADYTNVNLAAFIGLPLLAMTIFVLSWEASTVGLVAADENNPSKALLIDVLARYVYAAITAIIVGICTGLKSLVGMLNQLFQWMVRRYKNGVASTAHHPPAHNPQTTV